MNIKSCLCLVVFFSCVLFCSAQTIQPKSVIVSSQVTGNLAGRYNIGAEYFFDVRKAGATYLLAAAFSASATKTTAAGQNITGFDATAEINLYGPTFLRRKWNEYGGLKLMLGQLNNTTANTKPTFYFIGVGTGIQPIIAKRIAIKASVDIGYVRNGVVNTLFYLKNDEAIYSGIALLANVAVGIKL
jgi:hypothetical protein